MGSLRHSCEKVHEPSELRFGAVHGDDAACSQITLDTLVILLLRGREVETGIVVSVSLCVNLSCLSARISRKPHGQTKLIFFCGITNFLVF